MAFGYHGMILRVDLSKGSTEIERPDDDFYRTYVGGSAMGMYYLLNETQPGVDPLSPANVLSFCLSPTAGAPFPGQSRVTCTAKSPLTGCAGDSQSGGFFPAELKFSGFDAVVIKGRSPGPVYLWIHDGEAEIRDASHLWGMVTGEAQRTIRGELLDERIEIAQCGPAGERMVRFAAIMSMCNRANGRTGMGAVLGSKNLRALAVRGTKKPALADRDRLVELSRWGARNLEASDVYGLGLFGTAGITNEQSEDGGLPTRNWDSGFFENALALDGTTMAKSILKERDTCYACAIRCKRVVETEGGAYEVDPQYGGPEYETLAMLGACCGVDNLAAVARANQLCNMYGLDTISCGATIAWACNCFEEGLIGLKETDGLELRYGNAEAMVKLTEMIGRREGFGDILAEGSARAAASIGRGTDELVVAVKKQELPAHMPQVKRSLGLIYAVNPFGADHQSSGHDPIYAAYPDRMAELDLRDPQDDRVLNEEKVRFAFRTQLAYSCLDTFGICQFVFGPAWQLYAMSRLAAAIEAIAGWTLSVEDLLRIGERRLNLLRSFNAREGVGRDMDVLPQKLQKELSGGKSDGLSVTSEEIEKAKDMYYALAGWNVESGFPQRERLEELGLDWVADQLQR